MNQLLDETKVLIAGAGPVGLALSIELGLRGIDCVVVEKGDGIPRVPKMSSVSSRCMEFCRRWGIAEEVRYAVWSRTQPRDFAYVSTMIGDELARLKLPSYSEYGDKLDYSPEGAATCPQIFFDPILVKKAKTVPRVTLSYGTRLESFEQDDGGVRARLVDAASGGERVMDADYLVGCDGAGGVVRRQLDIPLDGPGKIATSVNVFFRSSEFMNMHDKGWARNFRLVDQEGCWAEAIAIDGKELWRLSVFEDPAPDLTGVSYLRRLAGRDFAYDILDVSPWERRDFLARSYRQGRVLIAGDAAHEMSPTGGAGMHTGICESYNLAWKLAAIHDGWGGTRLLDSYGAECRPVAAQYIEISTSSFNAIAALPGTSGFRDAVAEDNMLPRRLSPPDAMRAQFFYEDSPICVVDEPPPADGGDRLKPSARPGARAAHCWIGEGRSTIDLYGGGFVLVRFRSTETDVAPLNDAARARGVPLEVVDLDQADAAAIYEKSLALVRPDGHVAWRGEGLPHDATALVDRVRGA